MPSGLVQPPSFPDSSSTAGTPPRVVSVGLALRVPFAMLVHVTEAFELSMAGAADAGRVDSVAASPATRSVKDRMDVRRIMRLLSGVPGATGRRCVTQHRRAPQEPFR